MSAKHRRPADASLVLATKQDVLDTLEATTEGLNTLEFRVRRIEQHLRRFPMEPLPPMESGIQLQEARHASDA